MARKKRVSFVSRLGQTVSDMANAASVAATGSEIGVLELAAEDEFKMRPRSRKAKTKPKKTAAKKSSKSVKKKRSAKRHQKR